MKEILPLTNQMVAPTEKDSFRILSITQKLLPVLAFAVPMIILYYQYPASFEATWKGRTYYLFFLWLITLETIMAWDYLRTDKLKLRSAKTVTLVIALLLPTLFVIAANNYGFEPVTVNGARQLGIPNDNILWFPLATEYMIFTVLFALVIAIKYGIAGLGEYAISIVFLGIIGGIYMIDNLYPFGKFTPFQIIVPTTTVLAMNMLSLFGYHATWWYTRYDNVPVLTVENPQGRNSGPLGVAWPCSGVESLIIYTVTILLFLKKSQTSWAFKIACFSIGAIVTYLINGLRIATIFMIAADGGNWKYFHDYYGQLYSITWILCYPLIVMGALALWRRLKHVNPLEATQRLSEKLVE